MVGVQDLRSDLEALRALLVPFAGGMGGGVDGMPQRGAVDLRRAVLYAQMAGEPGSGGGAGPLMPRLPLPERPMSDALPMGSGNAPGAAMSGGTPAMAAPAMSLGAPPPAAPGTTYVPLGQLADIQIAGGPPMVRDEDGLLVGYVYVDIDQGAARHRRLRRRGQGGRRRRQRAGRAPAAGRATSSSGPASTSSSSEMVARMKIVVPLTLSDRRAAALLAVPNLVEVLIVLLSIPFALVGSVWLLWLLDYRLSTAVWVGIIALVGLAAQTGIVMIVYIDHAYERRKRAGKIRDLDDIIAAHMEGTVQRVRPKLMTVAPC